MFAKGLNFLVFDNQITVYYNRVAVKNKNFSIYVNGEKIGATEKCYYDIEGLTSKTNYLIKVDYVDDNGNLVVIGEQEVTTTKTKNKIDVTKEPYNAVGDGKTFNRDAIQKAFDDCTENDVIYFPKGTYITGGLRLHSNSEVYLEEGATIKGTDNPDDYLPFIDSRSEGLNMKCYQSVINIGYLDHKNYGYTCENVVLRGKGSIIGGGDSLNHKTIEKGFVVLKDYLASLGNRVKEFDNPKTIPGRLRGRLINVSNAKNVIMSGLYLAESPYWNIHFIYSDNVITHNCFIYTKGIHNGDGWDPDSSTNCSCFGTKFICGDNCVAVKSGRNPDGNIVNRPTKNINVFDCVVDGGGGFAVGSEISGGVEDVNFWNLDSRVSSVGIQIKTTVKRGGYVKNVKVYDSIFPNISISGKYTCNKDGEGAGYLTPISDIEIDNVLLTGIKRRILYSEKKDDIVELFVPCIEVKGFDEDPTTFKRISFKNCTLTKRHYDYEHLIKLQNFVDVHFENMMTENGD